MTRDINPFGLRMPAELRIALEAAAKDSGRSMNAEIVARLQESLHNLENFMISNRLAEMGIADVEIDEAAQRVKALEESGAPAKEIAEERARLQRLRRHRASIEAALRDLEQAGVPAAVEAKKVRSARKAKRS